MKILIDIFSAFIRIGLLGFGGGPTMIPLVHNEVVVRYKWMKEEEFANVLAIGNTLPGPIATKMAGYIGYKVAGYSGMFLAIIAITVPIIVFLICSLTLLNEYRNKPWVIGMAKGIIPVVAWMLTKLTWDFFIKGYKSIGFILATAMCVAAFILINIVGIHPALIIGSILITALFTPIKAKDKKI
ncbi:chromate transporter [Psychromonas sp.]|uniref:chromate transporter n=1 Tax=Psychromonas sp. TaxID=1884585 RepID=UPI0035669D33